MAKTFDEILAAVAPAMLNALWGEELTYLKYASQGVAGGVVADMAVGAGLSGSPADMAADGVIESGSSGFTSRVIRAIVRRERPTDTGGAPHGRSPQIVITVANSTLTGIATSEVDLGRDMIMIPVRRGQTPQSRRITAIIAEDAGMVTYEVQ